MPKVSVICSAYNACSCYSFRSSLESILNQTFRDFEFIICNDGSTDQTASVLNEYAEYDKRIKLIENKTNIGLAASLNKCISISKGEYIARQDCDDISAPQRLEKQISFLDERKNISVLGTFSYLFDEKGVWGKMSFPVEIKKKDFLFSSPHQHGSLVFRTDALLLAGGYRISKETRRCEDYDLFMRMHLFVQSANLAEYLYYFCEDKNTRKRRKYKYRLDEAKVRFKGFRMLGLMPYAFLYVIKPLIVGLIPRAILSRLQNKFLNRKTVCRDKNIPSPQKPNW